ncbi:tripartite tricarboxylate transporter substrate binding protein [Roseomonas sp. 18066]|uniref:Bug family tripartite tricarboxylate transporter substrate binding protein n=1 Tax=Roseomonas sp. 18066 TaxID=2681412 RepID=UPI00135CBFEB|nr:tripartite tricarboxylate transporter substrate binding protein [Roseomonas sp. 18066]
MRIHRRSLLAASLVAPAARAQPAFPNRPIRLIYPFAPGTGDGLARALAEAARDILGQPIVVENKPGANTMIGAEAAARASPDGHALGWVTTSTLALNPHFHPNLPYRLQDFAPLTLVYRAPVAFAAAADLPGGDFAGTMAHLRQNPGLAFGSVGNGSTPHLVMEMLQGITGIRLVNAGYRDEQAALADLMTGRIPLYAGSLDTLLPHRGSGRFRVLALSSPQRLPAAPAVPTFAELGRPELVVRDWHGICAPTGTPTPILLRLADALSAAVRSPLVQSRATPDMALDPISLEDFATLIHRDFSFYGKLIQTRGINLG